VVGLHDDDDDDDDDGDGDDDDGDDHDDDVDDDLCVWHNIIVIIYRYTVYTRA